MRVRIRLTPKEVDYVHNMAKQRNKKAKRFGSKTYNDTMTSEKAHMIGLAAEFAVAQLLDLKIDDAIYDNHGDCGVDLQIKIDDKDMGIAVKATTYCEVPFLRAEVDRNIPEIGIYVLCYVNKDDISDIEIIGWQYREIVEKAKVRKFGRYAPKNYVLTEQELRGIDELQ